MRNLFTVATLALVGCYSESKYQEEFDAKWCEQTKACGGECSETTAPVGSGFDTATADLLDGCDYDAKAAKDCIDAEWTCSPEVAGFSYPITAEACHNVYVCSGSDGAQTTPTPTTGS